MAQVVVYVGGHAGVDENTLFLAFLESIVQGAQWAAAKTAVSVIRIDEFFCSVTIYHLLDNTMDTKPFDEDCILLFAISEQLSKDQNIRIDFPRLPNHILPDSQRRPMTIIQPKPIKMLRHDLHIFLEPIPQLGRIFLFVPKSQLG